MSDPVKAGDHLDIAGQLLRTLFRSPEALFRIVALVLAVVSLTTGAFRLGGDLANHPLPFGGAALMNAASNISLAKLFEVLTCH